MYLSLPTNAKNGSEAGVSTLASLALAKKEAIILLKMWILPTVLLMATAYYPSENTIKALKIVFQTALGVDSWGVTLVN